MPSRRDDELARASPARLRPPAVRRRIRESTRKLEPVREYLQAMAGASGVVEFAGDLELVAALKAGDERAFAAIVDAWSGWMLRLARAYLPVASAAEEVVQETWLAVLRGLSGFRGDAALRTWTGQILVNQAKRHAVREQRTVPFASLTRDEGPTVDPERFQGTTDRYPGGWRQFPEQWPEQVSMTREVYEVVGSALAGLPDRQRAVVALRDIDGHSADEVCAILGISAGNQRVLLHRGRAVVRSRLEDYLGDGRTGDHKTDDATVVAEVAR